MAARKTKQTKLPRGYTAISRSSQSWPNDDTKKGDMVRGTVIEFDVVEVKRGKKKVEVEVAKLETLDGPVLTLWESAGLAPIFDYEEGVEVAIIFDGMGKAKRGQNAPRLYRIGVNE